MGWNNPGGNNRDPWSGGGGNQGPPDLDELLRRAKERLNRLFGGGSGGNSGGSSGGDGGGGWAIGSAGIVVILVVLVLGWLASGIYVVDAGWRGVQLRFGEHVRTTMPGPHWHMPYPIGTIRKVNVANRRRIAIGYEATTANNTRTVPSEALMLTKDENIVNVHLAVQYEVGAPANYLFNFRDPDQTLKSVTESALRETVGKHKLDFILTKGRAEVAQQTRKRVTETLDAYDAGIRLVEVAIQDVQPPEQVQDAFVDAIKAREDRLRLINQAQAYSNEIIPKAQGQAARVTAEAEGYREQVVAQAKGETARFTQVAEQYARAPDITRERLYIETMQTVLGATGNILVDTGGDQQSLLYLPVDRLIEGSKRMRGSSNSSENGTSGGAGGSGHSVSSRSNSQSSNQTNGGSRLRIRENR